MNGDGDNFFDDVEEFAFALGFGEEIADEVRDEMQEEIDEIKREEQQDNSELVKKVPLKDRHKQKGKVPRFEQYVRDRISGKKKAFDF